MKRHTPRVASSERTVANARPGRWGVRSDTEETAATVVRPNSGTAGRCPQTKRSWWLPLFATVVTVSLALLSVLSEKERQNIYVEQIRITGPPSGDNYNEDDAPIAANELPDDTPITNSQRGLVWHMSIPKTGSTTMNAILKSELVPGKSCIVKGKNLPELDEFLSNVCKKEPPSPESLFNKLEQSKVEKCEIFSSEWDLGMIRSLQNATRSVRPTVGTFTMLREPVARAVSEVNHMISKKRLAPGDEEVWNSTSVQLQLQPGCVHSPDFCSSLQDPRKCLLRGSCGIFQNFQSIYLAQWSVRDRPLSELVELSVDDEYLLSEAKAGLDSLEVFGLLEQSHASICLISHTFGWNSLFDECCTGKDTSQSTVMSTRCADIVGKKENVREYDQPDGTLLKSAAETNIVDVALYRHAERVFWQRVRQMEQSRGLSAGVFGSQNLIDTFHQKGSGEPSLRPWEQAFIGSWSARAGFYDGTAPLEIYDRGLAVYAVGESELMKAAKSIASARMVHGLELKTTLFTDLTGVQWVRERFGGDNGSEVFDRAINVFGKTEHIRYALIEGSKSNAREDKKSKFHCAYLRILKEGKMMSITAAARLHNTVVFTDADTYHCDDRGVENLFNISEEFGGTDGSGFVFVSNAMNSCDSRSGRACIMWLMEQFPGMEEEVNSGVFALNSKSALTWRVLEEWPRQYRAMIHTPCSVTGQDQKPLRVAIHMASVDGATGNVTPAIYLWKDPRYPQFHGYHPSDVPFNCRIRRGRGKDTRGICHHPNWRHCSILHGHSRASANIDYHEQDGSTLPLGMSAHWNTTVFLHIPKSGGHAFKISMLPELARLSGKKKAAVNINDGVNLFQQPLSTRRWNPPPIVHGSFSGDACRWIREIDSQSTATGEDLSRRTCGYITILRDPIDRLVSELNYCEEVKWIGEQACTGQKGATELRAAIHEARRRGGRGEALATFAERRGNVLLEHIAAPLTAADFFQSDQPADWHKRDKEFRVNPLEVRRMRQGGVNTADLAQAKLLLLTQYAVVGLLERIEETYLRIARAMGPQVLGRVNVPEIIRNGLEDSHNHEEFTNKNTPAPVSRSDLNTSQKKRLEEAIGLDIELYKFASEIFDLAGNRTLWEAALGSLKLKEQAAYGKQYEEVEKLPNGMDWNTLNMKKCPRA